MITHHDRHTDADATQGGAMLTPGPWMATRTETPAIEWWISACPAPNMEKDICVLHGDREAANAQLIAAAPDLAACCEAMLALLMNGVLLSGTGSIVEEQRAKIASMRALLNAGIDFGPRRDPFAALDALATRREPSDAGRVQDGETA